jgi:hypothetical protein
MGKTLCAIALVLAHPFVPPLPTWMPADGMPATVWYAHGEGEGGQEGEGAVVGQREAGQAARQQRKQPQQQQRSQPLPPGGTSARPSLGTVLWSTESGMQVRYDNTSDGMSEGTSELWVDAREDEWAWGWHPDPPQGLPSPQFAAQALRRELCNAPALARLQRHGSQSGLCKATLVIAPSSQLAHWAAELRAYAPSLKQLTYHASAHKRARTWAKKAYRQALVARMGKHDVVLTTAALACELRSCRFHRIVVDDVHAEEVAEGFAAAARAAGRSSVVAPHGGTGLSVVPGLAVSAPHVWLLTATPLTCSVRDLELGARLLGHWGLGHRLCGLSVDREPELFRDRLKALMVRLTSTGGGALEGPRMMAAVGGGSGAAGGV